MPEQPIPSPISRAELSAIPDSLLKQILDYAKAEEIIVITVAREAKRINVTALVEHPEIAVPAILQKTIEQLKSGNVTHLER